MSRGGVVWCVSCGSWLDEGLEELKCERLQQTATGRYVPPFFGMCAFLISHRDVSSRAVLLFDGVFLFLVFCLFVYLTVCGCQCRRITRFIRYTCGGVCGT